MAFKTKLDYSDNRQIKQFERTHTILSGGTSFGVTFSALTSGPDPLSSGDTSAVSMVYSNFSGNSSITNYQWYDSIMNVTINSLSALTPSNSGVTQNIIGFSAATTATTIDGNVVTLLYTGVTFDLTPISFYSLGGGNYSGTVETVDLTYLTASTLDYTGRTIWVDVSGITRSENLILTNIPVYADNTAASSLEIGAVYRTSTGQLMVRY